MMTGTQAMSFLAGPLAAALLLTLTPRAALADAPEASDPSPSYIYGGEETAVCGWPSAVSLGDCTGTLVHPELVIFAAHCMSPELGGSAPEEVAFGELGFEPQFAVATAQCDKNPLFDPFAQDPGGDYAYCLLEEPVTDVPIVPILMGCEVEQLEIGGEVTLVGYGFSDNGDPNYGVKREVVTTVNSFVGETEISVGGAGLGSCNGDSGGPAYVQLDDGTWRVFGITSRGEEFECGVAGTIYGMMHAEAVGWVEEQTLVDVTPCHDADGTWNPGPDCQGFPMTPWDGEGRSWENGCVGGDVEGYSEHCGAPFDDGSGTTGDSDSGGTETSGGPEPTSAGPTTDTGDDTTDPTGDGSTSGSTSGDGTDSSPTGETLGDTDTTGTGGSTDSGPGNNTGDFTITCTCTTGQGAEARTKSKTGGALSLMALLLLVVGRRRRD